MTSNHEVVGLIDAFGDALHAQDLARSMDLLTDDADVTVIPSEGVDVHRGPHRVRDFLARIYALERRYGWRWRERFVSVVGDIAWFVAVGDETIEEQGRTVAVVPYCLTGVAIRNSSGWRLRMLHASEDTHPTRRS